MQSVRVTSSDRPHYSLVDFAGSAIQSVIPSIARSVDGPSLCLQLPKRALCLIATGDCMFWHNLSGTLLSYLFPACNPYRSHENRVFGVAFPIISARLAVDGIRQALLNSCFMSTTDVARCV